jgi:hypothetical protein
MDGQLDIFGQQPFFTINTQICFAFTTSDTSSHETIVGMLNNGLARLSAAFPWLACDVVNEGSGNGSTGVYKFKASAGAHAVVVKDLSRDTSIPTMDSFVRAGFPISMLDEEMVAPRKTFTDQTHSKSAPAFLIQATFIPGGLLLTFLAQHNTMDMTGQAHMIRLFSKACCGAQFTSDELFHGNIERHNIVPLLEDSYIPGPELDRHIVKSSTESPASDQMSSPRPNYVWAYFGFSSRSLAALKSIATESVTAPAYISTDDALTALIWQSVQRARLPRLQPAARSSIARAIDVRSVLKISPLYPGPIQDSAYTTISLETLVSRPLGTIALHLRSALDPASVEFHARAVATFLSRTANKAIFSSTADFDMSRDLILSSWSKVQTSDLDFGLGLGRPKAVRRPRFKALEGLVFLMPKSLEEDVAAAICLREEDMNRLKTDAYFGTYAQYIG